ncbi:MAG TPA: chitosanase [Candidatus Binatia bacterium]|nr:chitosanase [Candidatus Binatia bacterium]
MDITTDQKRLIQSIVNVFETGRTGGDYGAVTRYADGPGGIRQVTYGRSQTTEYGKLRALLTAYVGAAGQYAAGLQPYIARIGSQPLVDDADFLRLLRDAGNDPVMRQTQDRFFDTHYYNPAIRWCSEDGFLDPLSALVVYDSFIHSGSVLKFLRNRFPEHVPAKGGRERVWVSEYVDTRHHWLATHSNPLLQKTIYRTRCFLAEIERNNWDLSVRPIDANGIQVS